MMRSGHKLLSHVDGMHFYRLMGSGKTLGRPYADWSVYGLLQTWENEQAALEFLATSELIAQFRSRGLHMITLFLTCSSSRGQWSGQEPFKVASGSEPDVPIAVLTRATIKSYYLIKFWKQARQTQSNFLGAEGLLFSKGIGEVPIKHMATLSIWEDLNALERAAYKQAEHQQAIDLTRKLNWYREELFARFKLYKAAGQWPQLTEQLADSGIELG